MKKKSVKKIVLIVVLCLAVAAAGVFCGLNWFGMLGGSHPLKTAKEGQIRVACVGDSITYGFGSRRNAVSAGAGLSAGHCDRDARLERFQAV